MRKPMTMKERVFRNIYKQIMTNYRSDFLVANRMFNPKSFMNRIKKKQEVIDYGGEYKVLEWLVDNEYITEQPGPDYKNVYFQITEKFSNEIKEEFGLTLRVPRKRKEPPKPIEHINGFRPRKPPRPKPLSGLPK